MKLGDLIFLCGICRKPIKDADDVHVDHAIPRLP